jgi:hypothetical protein
MSILGKRANFFESETKFSEIDDNMDEEEKINLPAKMATAYEVYKRGRQELTQLQGALSAAKLALRNKRKEYRDWSKINKPRRARHLVFADGSDGYGAYRKRRYVAYRGRYGSKYSRRRWYGVRRGRGGFFGDAWNAIKKYTPAGTFSKVGGWLGGRVGLAGLGRAAGRAIANYAGWGAYNRRTKMYRGKGAYNTMDGDQNHHAVLTQEVPMIHNPHGDDGAVVISHREYICDIDSIGAAFNITNSLPINPGIGSTFPWLSQIAGSFTQYKIEGMMFQFVSTSGALSTTQALGEIIMAVNYNSTDAAFTTKQQMLNEIFAVSKVPSENAVCPVECDPRQTTLEHLYIRDGAVPANQDKRFYDIGTFYIATQGQSAPCNLGELWVTYQVALYKPQMNDIGGAGSSTKSSHLTSNSGVSSLTPLGTNQTIKIDEIGLYWGTTYFGLPVEASAGSQYYVDITWYGANNAIIVHPQVVLGSNLEYSAGIWAPGNTNTATPDNNANVYSMRQRFVVKVKTQGSNFNTVTFGTAGNIPTGNPSMDLVVIQLDGTFK